MGACTSLDLDQSDFPHVSYYDATSGDLKYAYRNASGWHIETVDSEGDVGEWTSLALDEPGNPHISYHDATKGDLKYAYRNASGWYTETVDSAGFSGGCTGEYTSLALDGSGHPHISYRDQRLRILYAAMSESGGWCCEQVDWSADSQGPTSLALDELGSPHIGYEWAPGAVPPGVRYAYKDTIWHIDVLGIGGQAPSLALDPNGQPRLSLVGIYASAEVVAVKDGPTSLQPGALRIDAIWPNPSRGVVHARVAMPEGRQPGSLMFFDLSGRRLATSSLPGSARSGNAVVTLRLPDSVPSGQYFLTLDGPGRRQFAPIAIVR